MSIVTRSRAGGVVAAAAALAVVAGCGGSANDALPLIRATIQVKSVSMGGVCDTVPVRITPKELRGEANKYANARMMVTEVAMAGPTDEDGAPMCNGTAETLPLAPGDWEFSAPLRSGVVKCVRDIQAEGNLLLEFIDGVEGCSGPPPEPPPTMENAEGTEGEEGEEGAADAPGAEQPAQQ